jgi:acyl-CoA thioesterase
MRSWQFIPPELTLHCLRPPVGEWICMDARTSLQAEGTGLTTANLYDERGLVARSAQTLLIAQRKQ